MSLFVDVALRAASMLETHDCPFCGCCRAGGLDFEKLRFCCICCICLKWQNTIIWLDLNIASMLDFLVLKNAVECTSQSLKWTSGAWFAVSR